MKKKQCKIKGCAKPAWARKWCRTHYQRWRKNGNPLQLRIARPGEGLEFLYKVIQKPWPDECIDWPFGKGHWGYGAVVFEGKRWPAHRLVYFLVYGEIKNGFYICHAPKICHNRACVNPAHLREATPTENAQDKLLDGTHRQGECINSSKLTKCEVLSILDDHRKQKDIAKQYKTSPSNISQIKNKHRWKHLLQTVIDTDT